MHARLIFKLPEDRVDFELAYHGAKFSCAIDEIRSAFRAKSKYGNDEEKISWTEAYEFLLNQLAECDLPTIE